jgi:hypothetical protein
MLWQGLQTTEIAWFVFFFSFFFENDICMKSPLWKSSSSNQNMCIHIIFNLLTYFFFSYCLRTRLDDNEDVDRISSRKTAHIHKCLIAFSFFFWRNERTNEWASSLLLRRTHEYKRARQVKCVYRLSSIQFCRFLFVCVCVCAYFIVQPRQYVIRPNWKENLILNF